MLEEDAKLPRCAVCGLQNAANAVLLRLPSRKREAELYRAWVDFVRGCPGNGHWEPDRHTGFVCTLHFTSNWLRRYRGRLLSIKAGAVPTLYPRQEQLRRIAEANSVVAAATQDEQEEAESLCPGVASTQCNVRVAIKSTSTQCRVKVASKLLQCTVETVSQGTQVSGLGDRRGAGQQRHSTKRKTSTFMAKEGDAAAVPKQKQKRRWKINPFLQEDAKSGCRENPLPLLESRDIAYYRDYLRMPPSTFEKLVRLVGPCITKRDTNMRRAKPPDHRLALTLRFLAAGATITEASSSFLSGRSTACYTVSEVCQALWDVLAPIYVACPSTADEWLKVAAEFEEKWQAPNCLGAIDEKRIRWECRRGKSFSQDPNSARNFIRRLLAVSDAQYRFLYVEIGHFSRKLDGSMFHRSELYRNIEDKKLGIPADSKLGKCGPLPYFFAADETFPLETYVMRPYSGEELQALSDEDTVADGQDTTDQCANQNNQEIHSRRVFNYRLSRARQVVDNAFGVMAAQWRILQRPLKVKDENIKKIILACVALHNFLLTESGASRATYCPPEMTDTEDCQGNVIQGTWRSLENKGALSNIQSTGCHSSRVALDC
ncbi:uncharacterized protein LOC119453839 isoform X2 [Dermacentor silvarum]|uniref:uncharacterized protein LOC119453839 isoform X2 n=1 Tax=Dermacentor silvarum TaxID=543639 RepID=UPI00189AD452|nr:uncharacterized protein LOC119453839 isoform X2 [Dermacentor silvarum]